MFALTFYRPLAFPLAWTLQKSKPDRARLESERSDLNLEIFPSCGKMISVLLDSSLSFSLMSTFPSFPAECPHVFMSLFFFVFLGLLYRLFTFDQIWFIGPAKSGVIPHSWNPPMSLTQCLFPLLFAHEVLRFAAPYSYCAYISCLFSCYTGSNLSHAAHRQ